MAVDFPAPEKPVMTTRSSNRETGSGRSSSGRARSRRGRRSDPSSVLIGLGVASSSGITVMGASLARPVQERVDLAGGLRGQAGDGFQLLPARGQERLGRAEVSKQRALAHRADAGQV